MTDNKTPSPETHVEGGSFIANVHVVVDGQDFGKPTAEKRGRTSDLPYVPVIDHGDRTEQIKGFAFPDRTAAIEHAAKTIAFRRAYLFQQLKEPRLRALRKSHGLPADIPATPSPETNVRGAALADVAAERRRQIDIEGWTQGHDDAHSDGELARAASCYAYHGSWSASDRQKMANRFPQNWPWDRRWWKPKDARRDLVKAAALIIAEIERLDRTTEGHP